MKRRTFLASMPGLAAAWGAGNLAAAAGGTKPAKGSSLDGWRFTDVNVNFFEWPFRTHKYTRHQDLVSKLEQHGVRQAWVGSLEALFQKNIDASNARLAAECQALGPGWLLPFGSVNLGLPHWAEDLRRCVEDYRMPGVRLHPAFHNYTLGSEAFREFLAAAAEHRLVVQISLGVEDPRIRHWALHLQAPDVEALIERAAEFTQVPLVLLNALSTYRVNARQLAELTQLPHVYFELSELEWVEGIARRTDRTGGADERGRPVFSRLLFGSHLPFFPLENALFKLVESELTVAEQNALAYEHAEALIASPLPAPERRRLAARPAGSPPPGLPSLKEIKDLQIWDLHYHSVFGEHRLTHEDLMTVMDRFGIERIFALDVGRRAAARNLWTPAETRELDDAERAVLEAWSPRVLGLLRVFPSHLEETLERMERWIGQGPCIGIKFIVEPPSSRHFDSPENFTCAHPHADPIIRKAVELGALIYVHTYLKRPNWGGQEKGAWDPRQLGTGNYRGESSPMDLVQLAERFPDVPMICGHSGSDHEITLRTIRSCPNVLAEFSGHDPSSGALDLAVKELGVRRIVWGSHVPTRCLANGLSGVFEADLSQDERRLILGGNLRRLLAPTLRRKGIRV